MSAYNETRRTQRRVFDSIFNDIITPSSRVSNLRGRKTVSCRLSYHCSIRTGALKPG